MHRSFTSSCQPCLWTLSHMSRLVDLLASCETQAQAFIVSVGYVGVGYEEVLEELWDDASPVSRRQTHSARQRQTSRQPQQSRHRQAQRSGQRQASRQRQESRRFRPGGVSNNSRRASPGRSSSLPSHGESSVGADRDSLGSSRQRSGCGPEKIRKTYRL